MPEIGIALPNCHGRRTASDFVPGSQYHHWLLNQ